MEQEQLCWGLYPKAIERWQRNTKEGKKIRENFRQNLFAKYEKMLVEGGGTTLAQDGYETACNATEATMDELYITE